MAEYVSLDTAIFGHLTKFGPHSATYRKFIGDAAIAASFQVDAELLGAGYASRRKAQLDYYRTITLWLPHSDATSYWYARTTAMRRSLRRGHKRGSDASDADAWIISSALEHRLALLSHDGQQVALGRALGLAVFTALPQYRAENPT